MMTTHTQSLVWESPCSSNSPSVCLAGSTRVDCITEGCSHHRSRESRINFRLFTGDNSKTTTDCWANARAGQQYVEAYWESCSLAVVSLMYDVITVIV